MLLAFAAAQLLSSSNGACFYPSGEIVLQEQLPPAVASDLWIRAPDLSPFNGPFLATDVGEGLRNRFIAAAHLGQRYVVAYERGGRGYSIQVLTYAVEAHDAKVVNQRTLYKKPVCATIAAALTAP
ncbi:hypothetical protein [Caulobacter sp. UNC358MFTsu5.1]|uniref:hypothetical protein n=1 Tax=Caulobacter sp. UNC358MFTsu5.1 TaxID=1449049 RepID=UPI0004A7769A|nr:hypothetical protein [Caulobacter sp. UNC358MFTsu5.1]